MQIPRVSINDFNQNISKFIHQVMDGEVLYLTYHGKSVVVMISKKNMDAITDQLLEGWHSEWLSGKPKKKAK